MSERVSVAEAKAVAPEPAEAHQRRVEEAEAEKRSFVELIDSFTADAQCASQPPPRLGAAHSRVLPPQPPARLPGHLRKRDAAACAQGDGGRCGGGQAAQRGAEACESAAGGHAGDPGALAHATQAASAAAQPGGGRRAAPRPGGCR